LEIEPGIFAGFHVLHQESHDAVTALNDVVLNVCRGLRAPVRQAPALQVQRATDAKIAPDFSAVVANGRHDDIEVPVADVEDRHARLLSL
jgi:hypothetical protein